MSVQVVGSKDVSRLVSLAITFLEGAKEESRKAGRLMLVRVRMCVCVIIRELAWCELQRCCPCCRQPVSALVHPCLRV